MKVPKIVKQICPHCKKHTEFKVGIYKKGKDRVMAAGTRRYRRHKKGYGSQPKPIQHNMCKINKYTQPLLTCTVCGHKKYANPVRIKKYEIQTS